MFQGTVQSYKQGAKTMPAEYYISPEILAEEMDVIFARQWNCVGRASTLARAGDYMVRGVAGESIIVLRDRTAHCARSSTCAAIAARASARRASGHFSETIQCPYHAWTYTTDGRLIGAPHMQDVEGFDKKDYPLHSAAVTEHEGFVFVNIARNPEPFTSAFGPVLDRFSQYNLGKLKIGHSVKYDVHANWKLVFQNYSECLHCPVIHPELAAVLPYQSGANDMVEGPFLGGYMQLTAPNESATLSGRACGRVVSATLGEDDRHRAFYYSLMPNMLLSLQPDYVNYYIITPVAADRTTVESEWMFAAENDGDPKFNPQDAIAFWDVTNRQDWDIVARSQLGIGSRRYEPGPYSPRESIPAAWDREYLRMMNRL